MVGGTLISPWEASVAGERSSVPALLRTPQKASSPGTILELDAGVFRVCTFQTRRPTDPLTAPPRTVGWTGVLLGGRAHGSVGEAEAVQVCLRGNPPVATTEAARDKVVLCDRRGDVLVFQADRAREAASLCACGNAAGAAAAMLALTLRSAKVERRLTLPEGAVRMAARVQRQDGRYHVRQHWGDVRFHAASTMLAGRQVAVCSGTLNDYLIVRLGSAEEVEAFTLEETQALWGAAASSSGFQDILRCRLAAVSPDGALRFFTCGRLHPGAPLTGLAVLALAARAVDWLAPLLDAGEVRHRRGSDALPRVRVAGETAEVELPPVTVALGPG